MMKKALITGMNGTVAPALAAGLRARGYRTVAWDRGSVPPDDGEASRKFIRGLEPSLLVHCAMGPASWAEDMARVCAEKGIVFLYTSSASVYGTHQQGPFALADIPDPSDDYGRYKLECEGRVRAADPRAIIVRIGWQIALRRGGNNMVEHLAQRQAGHGHVSASTLWFPACSFLEDTARVLAGMPGNSPPGLYLLDGNPGLSFWEIATRLNRAMGGVWDVRAGEDFRWNNRMTDARLEIVSIEDHLARR